MLAYKIYPLPGICDRTLTGSVEASEASTMGQLLDAISGLEGVDFAAGTPFLALLDGKALDIFESSDRIVEDGSELVILPAIMGG